MPTGMSLPSFRSAKSRGVAKSPLRIAVERVPLAISLACAALVASSVGAAGAGVQTSRLSARSRPLLRLLQCESREAPSREVVYAQQNGASVLHRVQERDLRLGSPVETGREARERLRLHLRSEGDRVSV